MTAEAITVALSAAGAWLAGLDAPEGVIAAHESGMAPDSQQAQRWVRRVLDDQDASAAWAGDVRETAAALLLIQELRQAAGVVEQDPGVGRALDWLRRRRGAAGAWSDGCTPERHEMALCHHFLGGFFSAGPPEMVYGETRTSAGGVLRGDSEVRFVASTTALRALLAWGDDGPDSRLHLRGLGALVRAWSRVETPGLTTTALLSAVHALVMSPVPEDRASAEWGLRLVSAKQRGDGSWVETDAYQALEVLTAAWDAGISPEQARRALWNGARLLTAAQQGDGSWGHDYGARRALIAWRTLRRVEGEPPTPARAPWRSRGHPPHTR